MNDFYGYLRERQLAEVEGAGVGPGLGDLAGPREFGDDPTVRGGTSDTREAFDDLSDLLGSAMSGGSGKGLLNQTVALVMGDPQVPDRIKKEIEGKVKARWSAVIDITDKSGKGALPGGNNPDPRGGNGGMDSLDHKTNLKPTQADSGF
jgi:hypothetical protein